MNMKVSAFFLRALRLVETLGAHRVCLPDVLSMVHGEGSVFSRPTAAVSKLGMTLWQMTFKPGDNVLGTPQGLARACGWFSRYRTEMTYSLI